MRVKIFCGDHISDLQDEVNLWLTKHTTPIRFIKQSECYDQEASIGYTTISVWYDEVSPLPEK